MKTSPLFNHKKWSTYFRARHKTFEDKIGDLNTGWRDTADLFENFNEKNEAYFSSADKHISVIKDSLLRDRMKVLIASNLAKYESSIAKHNELLKIIDAKNMTISDLHNVLKIIKTLPLIEKYQGDNRPNTKPFEGYIKHQDESIKVAEKLIK